MAKPTNGDPLCVFGARVRARRTELGRSQESIAEAAGLHRTYFSAIERGERNPGLRNILRISVILEVDPADLVRGLKP